MNLFGNALRFLLVGVEDEVARINRCTTIVVHVRIDEDMLLRLQQVLLLKPSFRFI